MPRRARQGLAREVDHARLAERAHRLREPQGGRATGRLADHADHLGGGIGAERLQCAQHHETADLVREIAAADADRLRDALAQPGDRARDLLQPGARGGREADAAPRHHVGEAERHAVEDGGAAVGPEQEAPALAGEPLELHLRRDGHVVAEEHDVQSRAECAQRLGAGVGARHGDQDEIRAGQGAQRALERARRCLGAAHRGWPSEQGVLGRRTRGLGRRRVLGHDRDHEIGGAGRGAVLGEQPRLLEQRAVGRRAHHGRRARDARHGLHRAGQTHQRDGIAIERGAHEVERGHRPPILHHHSTAQPRGAAGDGWPVTASRSVRAVGRNAWRLFGEPLGSARCETTPRET